MKEECFWGKKASKKPKDDTRNQNGNQFLQYQKLIPIRLAFGIKDIIKKQTTQHNKKCKNKHFQITIALSTGKRKKAKRWTPYFMGLNSRVEWNRVQTRFYQKVDIWSLNLDFNLFLGFGFSLVFNKQDAHTQFD